METNNFKLFESKFHSIYLYQEGQLYIGRSVVVLNNIKPSLSTMTPDEWIDLGKVVKIYETALRSCFNATYFNWGCFLNDAYNNEPFTPKVHWQVRPRYISPVIYNGKVFKDEVFGSQFLRKDKEIELEYDLLKQIFETMKPHFQ